MPHCEHIPTGTVLSWLSKWPSHLVRLVSESLTKPSVTKSWGWKSVFYLWSHMVVCHSPVECAVHTCNSCSCFSSSSLCVRRQAGRRAWDGGVQGTRNVTAGCDRCRAVSSATSVPKCNSWTATDDTMAWLLPSVCPSAVSFSCHPVMSWWHGWQGSWKGALSTLKLWCYNQAVGDKSWPYLLTSFLKFPPEAEGYRHDVGLFWCCRGLVCSHDYLCGF